MKFVSEYDSDDGDDDSNEPINLVVFFLPFIIDFKHVFHR